MLPNESITREPESSIGLTKFDPINNSMAWDWFWATAPQLPTGEILALLEGENDAVDAVDSTLPLGAGEVKACVEGLLDEAKIYMISYFLLTLLISFFTSLLFLFIPMNRLFEWKCTTLIIWFDCPLSLFVKKFIMTKGHKKTNLLLILKNLNEFV